MIIIKTPEEIEILREGGKILAEILHKVRDMVKPGITTKDLDIYAEKLIREAGGEAAFKGYKPDGARVPFPAALCVSVNDEVVHGIPSAQRILKEGDLVALDLGLKHKGLFTDMALSVPVGRVDENALKILAITEEAMHKGIDQAKAGNTTTDISRAIENFVKQHKYGIVEVLSGHGVGRAIHEDPYIPNFVGKNPGVKLRASMVIAIEPMLNEGGKDVVLERDGYTFRTKDGKRSVHFEHTVLVTDTGPEILTQL